MSSPCKTNASISNLYAGRQSGATSASDYVLMRSSIALHARWSRDIFSSCELTDAEITCGSYRKFVGVNPEDGDVTTPYFWNDGRGRACVVKEMRSQTNNHILYMSSTYIGVDELQLFINYI